MTYLEQLRKARDKAQVAYQEFILHTEQGKSGLFCFFEGGKGTDNPYYIPRIKQFISEYYPIRCGGRDRVLEVRDLISLHTEYDKYKKAFFIDNDFHKPVEPRNPPVYETPCYSIENFYVSENVFREILKNILNISEVDPEYNLCIDLFKKRQEEFHNATTLFNAWYSCLIDIRDTEGKPTGVNLDDKLPRGFVNFSLDSVTSDYDFDRIKNVFLNAQEIDEIELNKKCNIFQQAERHKIFRGKYEMYFLLKFVELLLRDSATENKYVGSKINFAFSDTLTNDQGIALFSMYAETPESLTNYIKQVIANKVVVA